jgi:hypothetical protein
MHKVMPLAVQRHMALYTTTPHYLRQKNGLDIRKTPILYLRAKKHPLKKLNIYDPLVYNGDFFFTYSMSICANTVKLF